MNEGESILDATSSQPVEPIAEWFAVYCKPRQEKVALQQLENQGFEAFLPLANNPFQRLRPKRQTSEPLFPRYLFLKAVPAVQNLATVRSTRGVVSLVRSGSALVRVPKRVIEILQSQRDPDTGLIDLQPAPLKSGERVRVFDGPLAGAEGILQERCSETRSILLMNLLGRETTLEVESLLLQRAS